MIQSTPQSPDTKKDVLAEIIEVITNHLNASRIYVFGKRLLINQQSSSFSKENHETVLKSHFDLVVFTIKSYPDRIALLQDQIEKEMGGCSSATIYLHREIQLQQLTEKQSYFFYNIMKSENLVFQQSNYYYNAIRFTNPKPPLNYLIELWETKLTNANAFFDAAKGIRNPTKSGVILFNFHQLTEQLCLGLIAVFLNYYPTYFHLNYLFDICNHFTDLISKLFQSNNEIEKRVLDLLVQNPAHIRKDKPLLLCDSEILVLQNVLETFIEKSTTLVNQRITSYKNSLSY